MSFEPDTRASLLLRLRDPANERAWGEFLAIYRPVILRLARRFGLQDADAHELMQEVLLAVARAVNGWEPDRGRGSFRGWLFRVARNRTVTLLARRRRQAVTGGTEIQQVLAEHPERETDDPSQLLLDEERRQLFRTAAERIRSQFEPATWQAFWLTSVEGRPPRLVAEEVGLSPGAVYVARSRVMARLRGVVRDLQRKEEDS